jgi:probable F420-dependent oxidoreductase
MTSVGLCLPQLGPNVTPDALRVFCQHAEDLGYSSLWVQDHFLYPVEPRRPYGGRAGAPVPPQYQTVWAPLQLLTAAACWTQSPLLGTSVLVTGNHWPAPLAQQLATIDQLSGGRLLAGFGVGWNAEEHDQCGTDIATRGQRMDDFIPALLACWSDDPVSYEGPVFTIEPGHLDPKPIQRPRPPLLSGMWSEAGLARTATMFDAWNPAGIPIPTVVEMVAAMQQQRPAGMAPLDVYYRTFIQPRGRSRRRPRGWLR